MFSCQCVPGYSGTQCQTQINECASTPCMNSGVCTDYLNSYSCTCANGFTGVRCQTNINECASTPCLNGATCVDAINSFTCKCAPGYSGIWCQTEINECASNPCANGGTCADQINGHLCTCIAGYSGNRCQTDINECASSPCLNGGTCRDFLNSWQCTDASDVMYLLWRFSDSFLLLMYSYQVDARRDLRARFVRPISMSVRQCRVKTVVHASIRSTVLRARAVPDTPVCDVKLILMNAPAIRVVMVARATMKSME